MPVRPSPGNAGHPAATANLSQWPTLGLGTAPLGNLYRAVDENDALATLEAAYSGGIRYFDTAPFYGHGLSEQRLGRAMKGWPRESFSISTKVGRLIENDPAADGGLHDGFAVSGRRAVFDYSRDGVLRAFESSLTRLCTDRVDLLLLHDVGRLTHGDMHPRMLRQALDEALPTMVELRAAGAVGAIGIGVNEEAVCLEIMPRFPLDAIMLAGRYTLLEQQGSRAVLGEALRREVAIIAAGPFNSGLLADPRGPGETYDYAPADAEILARARAIYAVCAEHGVDAGAAALQFPLAHPAVAAVVAGQRSAAEVKTTMKRWESCLPPRLWQDMIDAGLLPVDTAVPG